MSPSPDSRSFSRPLRRLAAATLALGGALASAAPWVADLGDGRYRNPVLFADYSDPDVVRVGEDYWMTSSSFSHVPGLPILHSTDMIHWTLVNHALPRLEPAERYAQPQPGCGVWAPSIRYHDGRYWIFWGDPDFGIYRITATDPRGEWTAPQLVKAGKGLIDPCPLWDDDGQVYLVHAWARSRAGVNNRLTLHRLDAEATRVVDEGTLIVDADQFPGWRTLEGPKFYKARGFYWIFAPAGGVAEGYQAVFRAERVEGPYERRIVLAQGTTPINGPHQGAWVDTPGGEDWFFHFQERLPYGRIVHLQPMRWRPDGWPTMGHDPDGDGEGEPVLAHLRPALPAAPPSAPSTTDTFDGPALGRQWQWQANPDPAWAALDGAGLRLACVPWSESSLWLAPHLLLQKLAAPSLTARTTLALEGAAPGDRAGLIVFGYDYRWIGLRREAAGQSVVLASCRGARDGAAETVDAVVAVPEGPVELRVHLLEGGLCRFAYRAAGGAWQELGEPFQATESRWVGGKVGLFAAGAGGHVGGAARARAFIVE